MEHWGEGGILLALCAAAAVWPRLPNRLGRGWLGAARPVGAAALFAFLFVRLQGEALSGNFFTAGLWGRFAPVLAAAWVAGLALAYGWLGREGVPIAPLTLLALAGLSALAAAQGNYRALAGLAAIGAVVAGLWRAGGRAALPPGAAQFTGFLIAGAAALAESGPWPRLAFSAWWVALFVPLYETVCGAARAFVRQFAGGADAGAPSLYRLPASRGAAERLLYWGAAAGAALLALAHFAFARPGIHAVAAALGAAAAALEWAAARSARPAGRRRAPRWGGLQWAVLAALLFAFLTRAPNLLHQGFLTWDESRYAVIARDSLSTGDLGWTGGRPVYILLLSWVYAIWGAGDSTGGLLSLWAGALSIALVYAWARQGFGRAAGAAAAALLAASLLHGWFSRYQNSMAVALVFLACAGWARARAWGRPRPWRALVASGAALGLAWMSHYAVAVAMPFWLALAPFGAGGASWRVRAGRTLAFGAGLAAAVGAWAALMPSGRGPFSALLYHARFPIGCCLLDDMRYHLLPGSPEAGFGLPSIALHPAALLEGDWGFYLRAVLAFEGPLGFLLAGAALLWPFLRWMRQREGLVLQLWVVSAGPLAVLSLTAAAGLDARARTLMIVLPGLAALGGLAWSGLARALAARRPQGGPRAGAALLAGLLLAGALRGAPLRNMSSPYAEARDWLLARGADEVLVFNPYGDVNGFAWRFYFGEAAHFAANEDEALQVCAQHALDFLISAGEPLGQAGLGDMPAAARFANPLRSNVPRLYDQRAHSRFVGRGLATPPEDSSLYIFRLTGCPAR